MRLPPGSSRTPAAAVMAAALASAAVPCGCTSDGVQVGRTSSTTVDVSLQVWDSSTGELAWASTGWCAVEAEVVLATRASLNRALESVWVQMVTDLAERRSRSAVRRTERVAAGDGADSAVTQGNADRPEALEPARPDRTPKD